jgi:hypothetical protein
VIPKELPPSTLAKTQLIGHSMQLTKPNSPMKPIAPLVESPLISSNHNENFDQIPMKRPACSTRGMDDLVDADLSSDDTSSSVNAKRVKL